MNSYFRALFFLSLLGLSGCAIRPASPLIPSEQHQSWSGRQLTLNSIQSWTLKGALALRTNDQSFSANLYWQQKAPSLYTVNLFGPLGIGSVEINGSTTQVVLHHNNETYVAKTPEILLRQAMGWQLPVTGLYYWIRGLPAKAPIRSHRFDRDHHLLELKQLGWDIHYLSYLRVGTVDLPNKLTLENRYLHLRIVITQWDL